MTEEQKAAFIYSQAVCALAEIEAMKAANTARAMMGETQAYGEAAFIAVLDRYALSHNSVVMFFRA